MIYFFESWLSVSRLKLSKLLSLIDVNSGTFIGIDLAWHGAKRLSGVAVLSGGQQKAEILEVEMIESEKLPEYIDKKLANPIVVAIDGPLIISNQKGQRLCETEIGRAYGSRNASCHSSNLSLYPNACSVWLAEQLRSRAFLHAPNCSIQQDDCKVMLEVYPHVALIELFGLPQALKYKKGGVAQKRTGQKELQRLLTSLSGLTPSLESNWPADFRIEIDQLRGKALKANEDKLDAILCAYIAYYYWRWGMERFRFFGDTKSGYIAIPLLTNT